jgi:dolichyl-phosphate beta-glucosyltransferase
MYTQKAAKELHAMQTIMGFSFDLEILFLAFKYGYKVTEVPVSWIDAPGSKVDTKKEIQRFLRDLLNIQVNNFKGVYERK